MYLYRVSVVQELKPSDCAKRIQFCQWLLTNYAYIKAAFENFFFNDEARFIRIGYVNS